MIMRSLIGGRFKQWVKVQRLSKPVYEFDPTPAEWVTVQKVPCNIEPVAANEAVYSDQKTASNVTHIVSMRWMKGLDSSWRLVVLDGSNDARVLNIDSVINDLDDNDYFVLRCIERLELATTIGIESDGWIWQDDDAHVWQDDDLAIWN